MRLCVALLTAFALLATTAAPTAARARPDAIADIALEQLPAEARDVYTRIRAGGPFRYDRDGVVFGNREQLLPQRPRGYYHEYTVPTPGVKSRGAQRIVCGGAVTAPDICYYTNDHYRSFRRIRS